MPWLNDLVRHAHRIAFHKKRGSFQPPRPLDLFVLVHNSASTLSIFLEALVKKTRWPLRIVLCDNASTDPATLELLREWTSRVITPHSLSIDHSENAAFPDGFNTALRNMSNEVCLISQGNVIVPDFGKLCWATHLLQIMYDSPHVGWLNVSVTSPLLPGFTAVTRKYVRNTRRMVIRDTPTTLLTLVRRDCFQPDSAEPLQLSGIFQERLAEEYVSGRAALINAEPILPAFIQTKRSTDVSETLPCLFVITRTHNRPAAFRRCRESIERQTRYSNIVHIVTYETEQDLEYIPEECVRIKVTPNPEVPCWYETYINDALSFISSPGLVMFLDDDDYILNARLTEAVLSNYCYCDAIFFRTHLTSNRTIPATLPFLTPPYGDIASCGYALNAEIAKRAYWDAGHAGDFRYLSRIFHLHLPDKRRLYWSPDVLTSTQFGRSQGESERVMKSPLDYEDAAITLYRMTQDGAMDIAH